MHETHKVAELTPGHDYCVMCSTCTCHDEAKSLAPCEPKGFFMLPPRNPRQGSTDASPPESLN